jgi:hypothetical protein
VVRLVGPEEFAQRSAPGTSSDCVGIVRRRATEEWLSADREYFNVCSALMLRLHLSHKVVLVDEPWGQNDQTAPGRITHSHDPRRLDDVGRFVRDVGPVVGSAPCGPVDLALINMWVLLLRNRRYRAQRLSRRGWLSGASRDAMRSVGSCVGVSTGGTRAWHLR